MKKTFSILALLAIVTFARAHDTWVQTNTHVVRVGDVVHIDLMQGNHGNDHRDFKLAGKASLENATLEVIDPSGARHDLRPALADRGMGAKEGFWSTSFNPGTPGLHIVAQTSDRVVDYAPIRSIKSAKTMFVASKSLDNVPLDNPGHDRVLGHPFELVALDNPVTPMGPGTRLRVQLLRAGKPLAGARISFIPSGVQLAEAFDETYERTTDANGIATFEPADANRYLIVAHHADETEKGDGFDSTKYSATLTLLVPAICPCCGE